MVSKDAYEIELNWQFMLPMEQSVWATLLALHLQDDDGGLGAADAGIMRLRSLAITRARRPEPEQEAARLNVYMEFEDFAGWYPIAYKMMHKREAGYQDPDRQQVEAAYETYARGRTDYY